MNRIIIFEPHPFHYEVILSVAYYLDTLGCDITIMTQANFDMDDLFALDAPLKRRMKVIVYKVEEMRKILSARIIEDYDYIFFNSMEFFHDGKKERLLDYLGFCPKTRKGILGIYHNKSIMNDKDIDLIRQKRIFGLSKFDFKGYEIPLLSTCYFGNIEATVVEKKNDMVLVGLSNRRIIMENAIEIFLRNGEILPRFAVIGNIKWYRDLIKRLANNLVYDICNTFKLKFPYEKSTIRAWKSMSYYGNVNFEDMFNIIRASKYIAIVLDPQDSLCKDFLGGKTSGSKNLCLGFEIPCIINEKYARSFQLAQDMCVTYEENDIYSALKKICSISADEYEEYVNNVRIYKKRCMSETLINLETVLV